MQAATEADVYALSLLTYHRNSYTAYTAEHLECVVQCVEANLLGPLAQASRPTAQGRQWTQLLCVCKCTGVLQQVPSMAWQQELTCMLQAYRGGAILVRRLMHNTTHCCSQYANPQVHMTG